LAALPNALAALPTASISLTGPLLTVATHVIRSLGLGGIALMTATTGVIAVPGTEPTMLFAGFNVYEGHLSLIGILIAGIVGDTVGASIAYSIGHWGGQELIDRQGAKIHLSPRRIARAHRWFSRYGTPAIVLSRLIPFGRFAVPYAAGVAEMPYRRFIAAAVLGTIPWIVGLGLLGREVGSNWQSWRHHLDYADYTVIALIIVGLAYLVLRRVRTSRSRAAVDAFSK
jgi:membrane protein DedA with SNARE-associated domain